MILQRCLGKLPPRIDPRTLQLSSYLRSMPAPPPMRSWANGLPADLGMYRNDEIGNCGLVAPAHLMRTWASCHGGDFAPSTADVVAAYAAVAGFREGHPETDRGTDMLSVLKHWRKVGIAGRRIRAFVKLDHDDWMQLRIAVNLFGGLYVGASLPRSAMHADGAWDLPPGRPFGDDAVGSWGGHAMAVLAYDRTGVWFATWGRMQRATWHWFMTYVDEAYACLADLWSPPQLIAPNGLDAQALLEDLHAIEAA